MARKIFGTDGIRGKANSYPMTPELALQLGKALAKILTTKNGKGRKKILIGKDTRLSGYMIETALTSGLVSMGCDVILVGPIPTPAIAQLTKSLTADAGIVISASHNPADDNGIKIFSRDGYKLNDELEEEIEKLMFSGSIDADHVTGTNIGKASRVEDAKGRYIEFCKSTIGNKSLSGLKVVLDCANGAAYNVAPKIISELGAELITLNAEPDGLNINNGCGALHPEAIQSAVKKHKADIGIALDGDADRIVVCDEKGNLVNGDSLLAMFTLDLNSKQLLRDNTIVTTVMSNYGFYEAMQNAGISVKTTPVGDRYVIEEIKKHNYTLGGEQSGHIIFADYSTTGDGIISALQLLSLLKSKGKLSWLSNVMVNYPQVLLNVKVKQKGPFNKIPKIKQAIENAEKEIEGKGRVLVRYSGTENLARVMVEGKDKKQVASLTNKIAAIIKKEIGV